MGIFRRDPLSLTASASSPSLSSTPSKPTIRSVSPSRLPALTAAAQSIDITDASELERLRTRAVTDAWQAEAWDYYNAIGEIKYAFNLVANVTSRVRLYAAFSDDPSIPPRHVDKDVPTGQAARRAVARLDSAFGGQPGLLRDAALNLSVVGECLLVKDPADPVSRRNESWDIRSTDEVEVSPDRSVWLRTRASSTSRSDKRRLPPGATMIRIWRPHPRYTDDADSSMLGLLDACAELLLINRTFRATARSRLNSGLLFMPDGLSVSAAQDPDATPGNIDPALLDADDPEALNNNEFIPLPLDPDEDSLEEDLIEAMTTPIADEESASAVVPLLVRGPAESGAGIKYIQFERSFDPGLAQRADRVLDRIMQGIDVPKDVVTGLANVKYSNAVQIDESLYRSHIEPLVLLICDALTVGYLHPHLRAQGVSEDEIPNYLVWYDASDVTTRPNRAEDADKGYELGLISGAAWRREHGFSEDDAPTPNEIAFRKLLEAPVTQDLADSLLAVFAPEVMAHVREASQANNPAPLPPEVTEALGGAPAPAPALDPDAPADAPTDTPDAPASTDSDRYGRPPGVPAPAAQEDDPA